MAQFLYKPLTPKGVFYSPPKRGICQTPQRSEAFDNAVYYLYPKLNFFDNILMSSMTNRCHLNISLYKTIYLIRSAEKAIIEHYDENEMKTPMHMSMGGEAISAGVCRALSDKGQFLCSYRSHAVYLANSLETDKLFGELYGRVTGMVRGKAGSMHLSSPETGFLGASAIVASTLPVAIGVAFANKYNNTNRIVAVFFGDGALEEGNFWETLNMACLLKLPIIFVCEDNGYAVHNPVSKRHGYRSITDLVKGFNCGVLSDTTTDVEKIYNLTLNAMRSIKDMEVPCFLYLKYYRYLEHVGVNEDFNAGYRTRDEFYEWKKIDPINLQRTKLVKLGVLEEELERIESKIDNQVKTSLVSAKNAPFPDRSEAERGIFYE